VARVLKIRARNSIFWNLEVDANYLLFDICSHDSVRDVPVSSIKSVGAAS
jgi:hypothetical protein